MLEKFEFGFKRAFLEVIGGLLAPILLSSFVSTGLIPLYFIWLFHLLSIASIVNLIRAMSYWSTFYIFGWLVGIFLFAYSGLLTIFDFLLYIVPLIYLAFRLVKWIIE